MSPRTAEQFHNIRTEKKGLIMETALELFAEKGYHATSINQIAQKAGISKGLTYNYFESKMKILEELISHGFEAMYANFDLNHDGILTEDEFVYFIKQIFKLIKEDHRHWKLYFSLMLQPIVSETFSEEYAEKGKPMFKMMYDFIVSKGSINPEGDLMAISSMIEGAMLYMIAAPHIFPTEKLEESVISGCFKLISTDNNSSK